MPDTSGVAPRSTLTGSVEPDNLYRILSLDGGGAKGFYTLGVLKEMEAMIGCPLYKRFDLVFGTSTGSIIAALIALGFEIDQIHELYCEHVVRVVRARTYRKKSEALRALATAVFGDRQIDAVKTGIGIVATRWLLARPMIFKANIAQAHGRAATFVPGFGCSIAEAVQASCSAYPFFDKTTVTTSTGDVVALIDGGYCANNPTLYALADALHAVGRSEADIRVVSVGVGVYPEPRRGFFRRIRDGFWLVELLQKTLEINTQSMEQLRAILFRDIPTIRICDTFERPELAADLFEYDLEKLNLLRQQGRESFAIRENIFKEFLLTAPPGNTVPVL